MAKAMQPILFVKGAKFSERALLFLGIWLGYGLRDKLNILGMAVLQLVPVIIRERFSALDEKIEEITERLLRGTVVKIDDIKYAILDRESFLIVSPEYYEVRFMPIWFKPRRGDVLVDIGAHIGKYTVTAAKLVGNEGMVVAIEPCPVNYHTLLRNIGFNKLQNVIALNFAAWDEDCELKLFTGDTAGHHSAKINRGLGGFTVKAKVMDHILKELHVGRVDWIKIDVEGAECEVLYGLEEIISKHKPKMIIEVFYENLDEMKRFMKECEYGLIRISPLFEKNAYFLCIPFSHARKILIRSSTDSGPISAIIFRIRTTKGLIGSIPSSVHLQ